MHGHPVHRIRTATADKGPSGTYSEKYSHVPLYGKGPRVLISHNVCQESLGIMYSTFVHDDYCLPPSEL